MVGQCWSSIYDVSPTLTQHLVKISDGGSSVEHVFTGDPSLHVYMLFPLIILGVEDAHMRAAEWESSRIHELDLTSTELSAECLQDVLCRIPSFTFLGLGYCEFFTDKVKFIHL